MGETIDRWIESLVAFTGLDGMSILLITIPLGIAQGFLGLFPFATLIMLHISALGLVNGILASWLTGTVAAVVVFGVGRFLFANWVRRKWERRLQKYDRWKRSFEKYGLWAIIMLRTIPIMPNNLISFMAAVSPVRILPYVWSSVIGNLSHIWLLSIISSAILIPEVNPHYLIFSYAVFCAILLAIFFFSVYRKPHAQRGGDNEFTL
ncbi:TVP38/TMEM64 family protein [Paenibacillaceae bacterium WGS1546]|uniref:TVP38/TMEM64 family protein n=1 Tax=Cohnella sp. WGS1546 TaxID=3366810 RepID=UPI00372D06B4